MLTILFAYSIDFKDVIQKLDPQQIVESINATVNVFDFCADRFDVFKVETKADSSYMVVAGIHGRSAPQHRRGSNAVGLLFCVSHKKTLSYSLESINDVQRFRHR